ncbi:MAG TPA: DUF6766 family protein [Chloroflexota bacterium]|jgi:hypothetical protein|nr:DUF6766 family protein [Chloroflexota bacterium]
MARILRENGLSLALFSLFLVTIVLQAVAGVNSYNHDQLEHGEATVDILEYLGTGHFMEAVFENWESEFLQMALFVLLTVGLRQKGSPESKKLEGDEEVDEDPRLHRKDKDAPWPVRQGGLVLALYEHSLSLTLFVFFVASFLLHAAGGAAEYSAEQEVHGESGVSMLAYIATSRFWFESFQNWQSEFLSLGLLVVLSVYLRERGSPESKPVHHPHHATGRE